MGFARFLSLSYSSYSVCIYNIYNITVCNNYILFVRLWANSFRATDEHKLRALYLHLKSVLLMSFVIYVLYMCTYMCIVCVMYLRVCILVFIRVCVCVRICSDALRPTTTFVSRPRNVNVALSSSRAKRWSQVRERPHGLRLVRLSRTHGEGDFGTYIINNRITRRYDTTRRWWNVRRDRATHTSRMSLAYVGCYYWCVRFAFQASRELLRLGGLEGGTF